MRLGSLLLLIMLSLTQNRKESAAAVSKRIEPRVSGNDGTITVVFYNVFEGMGGEDDKRVATLKSYISSFDVIGFSELNGWTPTTFREYFADVFPHSTFLTNTP